jgi:hypothetical protein
MNLPFFKRFNKKILPLYYLVLVLRDEKAEAVIFEEIQGVAKIIGVREQSFSASIDQISQEEFLVALDKAISGAESSLPENIQTQKTIFGVKQSWTDNDQIKKEYLAKLKKASEELGLVPIGFLVISQAIAHLLQKEEGVPVSAILTEINKKSVTVTLLRSGKNVETKSAEIHESIPFTVDTLLKHFNIPEILPSRIILFDGKEDFSQEFISHTWSKSLPFLHLPQITNLSRGFEAKAVLFGAATQMGFQIPENELTKKEDNPNEVTEEIPSIENEPVETPMIEKNLGANNFGFAKDVDVAKMEFQEFQEEEPSSIDEMESKEEKVLPSSESGKTHIEPESSNRFKKIIFPVLNFIFAAIRKVDLKKFHFRMPSGKPNIILPAVIILIAGLVVCYFTLLKATVTITVDPKISEQTKSIIFSTTDATDPAKNIIRGDFVSVSEDGSVSTPATGKKDVGTPAKGTVTIFNSLTQAKTLEAGTTLKSLNGLEFTLDSSVTINAVASHSADETVTPTNVSVNVTASQLGKESNLPSGTKFSVDSFDTSDLIAKNDNPFSGGTKSQITVVSKNDSSKLETDLVKQMETKAKDDLLKHLDNGKILLPAFVTETLNKESLSAKIGDQANQVTLTGTVDYQGISYNKTDLVAIGKTLLSNNIPSNQEIDYNNIRTSVLDINNKSTNEIDANLNIKGLLLPKIDQTNLVKNIKGKSFKESEDFINKLPQVSDVNIQLSPNLFFLPKNLPSREKNIKVIIKI